MNRYVNEWLLRSKSECNVVAAQRITTDQSEDEKEEIPEKKHIKMKLVALCARARQSDKR